LGTFARTSSIGTKKPPWAAPAFAALNNSGWFQVVTSNGGLSTPPATNLGSQGAALMYSTVQLKSFWKGSRRAVRSVTCQAPPQLATRKVAPSASKISPA
jgi:hypothetical protein